MYVSHKNTVQSICTQNPFKDPLYFVDFFHTVEYKFFTFQTSKGSFFLKTIFQKIFGAIIDVEKEE